MRAPAYAMASTSMLMFFQQLRHELWKLFGKKRTYIGFIMFLITQNIVSLVFKFTRASRPLERMLEGNGYLAESFISALTIAVIMMIPLTLFLLPLYVALIGGDLVAKEAEDGTLRMILSRPISRGRLLLLKWLSGVVFSMSLVLCLGLFGLLFARLYFPWNSLFVWMPEAQIFSVFEPGAGLAHYAAAHGMMVTLAVSIMGAAFMFSCFNMKPAAATILALSYIFVNFIMQHIPYFHDLRAWFLTYHLELWQLVFAQPVPWPRIGQSLCILAGYNLTFLIIGLMVFHARDIKS